MSVYVSKGSVVSSDDYELMYQWHPEMILVSKSPVTWHGFLSIPCQGNSGRKSLYKLKLIVPNYPSLSDADVFFGEKMSCVFSIDFRQRVSALKKASLNVATFLRQLQSLIGSLLDGVETRNSSDDIIDSNVLGIIDELKIALQFPSEVQMFSDNNLNTIKLRYKNCSLKLQRTKDTSCHWKVVSSDLPEIQAFGPFETNLLTLSAARDKFKLQVEMLKTSWEQLREIDLHCCVIDPLEPKPSNLYRHIFLSSSSSMLIKVDPLNPTDLPEIKFMGTEAAIDAKKDIVSSNIHKWDHNCSILENLKMLLDIDEFPRNRMEQKNDESITTDVECCICFCLALDNHNFPDKICNNDKCRRHFHTPCLLQWLQAVAGNHVAFNQIHGSCPHCGESISCPID